jgi:chromosome segregation ATPase
MTITPTLISIAGLGLTILTIILASARHTHKIHEAELREAERRGELAQRINEAEDDINNLGQRIRSIEGGISTLDQGVAAMGARVQSLTDTINRLDGKIDRLIYRDADKKG